MDRGKLSSAFAENREALASITAEIEDTEAQQQRLKAKQEALIERLRELSSRESAIDCVIAIKGDDRDKLLLGAVAETSHSFKTECYQKIEAVNNTLETLRALMTCGEPFLVLTQNRDVDPEEGRTRSVYFTFSGSGMSRDPVVFAAEDGYCLGDVRGDNDSKLRLTQATGNRQYMHTIFANLVSGHETEDGNLIYKGREAIISALRGLKDTDPIAFLIAATSVSSTIEISTEELHIQPHELLHIRDKIVRCIVAASLKQVEYDVETSSYSKNSTLQTVFEGKVMQEGDDQYTEIANRLLKSLKFRNRFSTLFGIIFTDKELRQKAVRMQQELASSMMNLRTPLGSLRMVSSSDEYGKRPDLYFV